MTEPMGAATRQEEVIRGSILALLAIPAGVILWVLLWSVGFIASIVTYVVAIGAVWLYRRGSGGLITRTGAWVVTLIVAATVLISFWAGMVVDYSGGLGKLAAISQSDFWPSFQYDFAANLQANLPAFGLAILFAAWGAFSTLKRAFRTATVTAQTQQLFAPEPVRPEAQREGEVPPQA